MSVGITLEQENALLRGETILIYLKTLPIHWRITLKGLDTYLAYISKSKLLPDGEILECKVRLDDL